MKRGTFKKRYKPNKYKAIKTLFDGVVFDSKLEAGEYEDLKLLQAAGEISDLDIQHDLVLKVNDKQVCIYIADFFYFDVKEKKWVVSDAKGILTDVFKLKWKLAQALYPEYIYEIRKRGKIIRS